MWKLQTYLKKISPDCQKLVIKKLFLVTNYLNAEVHEDIPSLSKCCEYLGKAEIRLNLIQEINTIIAQYTGSSLTPRIEELYGLRESTRKQISLLQQMVRGHLQLLSKEKEIN